MTQSERLEFLIKYLLQERGEDFALPADGGQLFRLYRGLVNVREPLPAGEDYLAVEDEFLRACIAGKGVTQSSTLTRCASDPRISIWQGDITLLDADAIVNAANSALLGCFAPNHACIDNCIHTFAGVRLRLACAEIMRRQGHPELTGTAKLTPAFNLPSRFVLHTVGPITDGSVSERDCELLASCYRSCFSLADEQGLESIAFCCISTGVFRFPNDAAAEIAVKTVQACLDGAKSIRHVVFNVFKPLDLRIYTELLR